jgi:hypothetical protein
MRERRFEVRVQRRHTPRGAIAAIALWAIAGCFHPAAAEPPKPLARAHAHNDYQHRRPLFDALAHGFCSVEADVFLVDGKLLVAHDVVQLRPDRTLRALYLDPLRERVKANGGAVYPGAPTFWLLIDLKTDGEKTYAALAKTLSDYADLLTVVRDGKAESGAVTVVLSGNRPRRTVAAEKVRYVGLDGRLEDLRSDEPPHLIPWISDNWTKHFQWRGEGELPAAEREKLKAIVRQAHAAGRRLRFWGAPDRREAWRALSEAGVDWINTDDLAGLAKYLSSEKE